ncbi:MAG: 3-oxoacyl-ACP synthase [Proteobacteria bacterium]|nr:3-oxoacyl-ACP synthase [Pseudomonadota bacterium]
MKTRIESLGAYLPVKEVSTSELISRMAMEPTFDLEKITGIKKRRVRSENESTYTMAIEAAEDCLSHSTYKPEDIDIIISASITRTKEAQMTYIEPPMSLFIKNHLGAHHAMNFDITNACAGMNTGAYILNNMIKAGTVRRGMVVSGECITPIADTAVREISEPIDDQFASLTVGDSGAAFIMDGCGTDTEGIDFIEFMTTAGYSHMCLAMPSETGAGIAMYTKVQAMHKKDLIHEIPLFIQDVFEKRGTPFDPAGFDYIIPHQVSIGAIKSYMKSVREHFNTELPDTLVVVEDLGNTSSTSHFVVMYTYLKNKQLKKGDRLFILSTASGLNVGLMSMTLGDLEVA